MSKIFITLLDGYCSSHYIIEYNNPIYLIKPVNLTFGYNGYNYELFREYSSTSFSPMSREKYDHFRASFDNQRKIINFVMPTLEEIWVLIINKLVEISSSKFKDIFPNHGEIEYYFNISQVYKEFEIYNTVCSVISQISNKIGKKCYISDLINLLPVSFVNDYYSSSADSFEANPGEVTHSFIDCGLNKTIIYTYKFTFESRGFITEATEKLQPEHWQVHSISKSAKEYIDKQKNSINKFKTKIKKEQKSIEEYNKLIKNNVNVKENNSCINTCHKNISRFEKEIELCNNKIAKFDNEKFTYSVIVPTASELLNKTVINIGINDLLIELLSDNKNLPLELQSSQFLKLIKKNIDSLIQFNHKNVIEIYFKDVKDNDVVIDRNKIRQSNYAMLIRKQSKKIIDTYKPLSFKEASQHRMMILCNDMINYRIGNGNDNVTHYLGGYNNIIANYSYRTAKNPIGDSSYLELKDFIHCNIIHDTPELIKQQNFNHDDMLKYFMDLTVKNDELSGVKAIIQKEKNNLNLKGTGLIRDVNDATNWLLELASYDGDKYYDLWKEFIKSIFN